MSHFVISNASVFDGEQAIGVTSVEVADGKIVAVGDKPTAPDADQLDGTGCTLLPGLIDAHTHSDRNSLRQALQFGITTELDMLSMPATMQPLREEVKTSSELADVRSPSFGLTPPGGHPHQLRTELGDPEWPAASSVDEIDGWVEGRIAEGADYLKVLVEDGHVMGMSMPTLPMELVAAVVASAHARQKMVLVHTTTLANTAAAIATGVDGLAHLFVDQPATEEIIQQIAAAGIFVVPTMVAFASLTGRPDSTELADDERVKTRLSASAIATLNAKMKALPPENFEFPMQAVAMLRDVGVDILAGTDAADVWVPGITNGASLHDELRLLNLAGLSTTDTLRAATSLPARRFSLGDRGRIQPGLRADLLLVDGDPLEEVGATLSTRAVWRGGKRVALSPERASASLERLY